MLSLLRKTQVRNKLTKTVKRKMLKRDFILLCLVLAVFISCTSKESPSAITYSTADVGETADREQYTEVVEVPFREVNGVRVVPVTINGVDMTMIFDTGASTTCISVTEAIFLFKQGLLTQEDILGKVSSTVADGRITQNTVVRLKEVVVGGRIVFTDVRAVVQNNMNAPLLLGNADILDRVASFKIDNDSETIHFILK